MQTQKCFSGLVGRQYQRRPINMSVATAGRLGGVGRSGGENDGAAGGAVAAAAAADVRVGPPPRLRAFPPKVDTLPAHMFSAEQRAKIESLRRYFDSLEIIDEDVVAGEAAELPSRPGTGGLTATTRGGRDGSDWNVVREETVERNHRPACQTSGSDVLVDSSDVMNSSEDVVRGAAGSNTSCNGSESRPAPQGISEAVEVFATSSSSWFSWNFLRPAEPPSLSGAERVSSELKENDGETVAAKSEDSMRGTSGDGEESADEQSQHDPQHRHQEGAQAERQEEKLKLYWDEVLWLEDYLILSRYLRSYEWNIHEARKQLIRTLLWRRRVKPQHLSPNQVATFARTGSIYRKGFDIYGRGVVYFKPGREASTGSQLFQRYVVYTVERALESLEKEAGVDQLVFIVDFSEWGILQLPKTEISREIVSILNDHYTDVLAAAFIVNAPSYFDPLWRLLSLMVHADTANKIVFVKNTPDASAKRQADTGTHSSENCNNGGRSNTSDDSLQREDYYARSSSCTSEKETSNVLCELIPSPYLEQSVGGDSQLDYDHDVYWQAEKEQYLQQCIHRRQTQEALRNSIRTRRKLQQQQEERGLSGAAARPETSEAAVATSVSVL